MSFSISAKKNLPMICRSRLLYGGTFTRAMAFLCIEHMQFQCIQLLGRIYLPYDLMPCVL